MSHSLDCISAAYLEPTFQALSSAGVNMSGPSQKSYLGRFRLEDPSTIVPQACACAFFEYVTADQGREVTNCIASWYNMKNIPGWGGAITGTYDVLEAINLAGSAEGSIISDNRVQARVEGVVTIFEDLFLAGTGGKSEWKPMFSLLLAIDGFRAACGPNWMPLRIDTAFKDVSVLEDLFDLSDVEVRTSQSANRLYFDTTLLAKTMPKNEPDDRWPSVPERRRDRLIRMFGALEEPEQLNIASISRMFDISPRSLQRSLSEEDTTFSEALKHWRFVLAVQSLHTSRQSVTEIAERLGYRHSTHFIRAFRRWTGVTPQVYRENRRRVG